LWQGEFNLLPATDLDEIGSKFSIRHCALRSDTPKAVQYGGRYGERATQKQSREKEAEG
jgi:hypothetical protein